MKTTFLLIPMVCSMCTGSHAAVVYEQPPNPNGVLYHSSWWDPDGSDYDQYVWDSFVLGSSYGITTIQWRGGFDPAYFGSGGPVVDFTVAIYPSIPTGIQPDVVHPPLVEYQAGGNAGQTLAGVFGGVTMYDYSFTLPVPFQAAAGVRYWVQIEAWQHGIPDWGISSATSGDGSYFRCIAYVGDIYYQTCPGDAAFAILAPVSGVDEGPPAALALETVGPNPSPGKRWNVAFTLPSGAPALLEMFGVDGRRVAMREVGDFGAGHHAVNLSPVTPVADGLYFLRLRQGTEVRSTKVMVIR